MLPIVKRWSGSATPADANELEAFLDEYADAAEGALLLYAGTEVFPLTERVLAAPWWAVC